MLNKHTLAKKLVLPLMLLGAPAFAGETFILAEFGRSEIQLDASPERDEFDTEDDGGAANFVAGYRFDNNFILAGNFVTTVNDDVVAFNDRLTIFELGVSIGYAIPLGSRVNLIPAVGVNRWELDLQEGRLGNPGPEQSIEERGEDSYWRVALEIKHTDLIGYSLSYTQNKFDFGETESVRFGLLFTF